MATDHSRVASRFMISPAVLIAWLDDHTAVDDHLFFIPQLQPVITGNGGMDRFNEL